eukprot:g829.t1
MGSLLPGWDTEPHQSSVGMCSIYSLNVSNRYVLGIKQELKTEKELFENQMYGGYGGRIGTRPSIGEASSPVAQLTEPPSLGRKSAPSSIIIEQLQKAEQQKQQQLSFEKQQKKEDRARATKRLFSRDKWWRKFSSANLNDLSTEVEKEHGQNTYIPQFDLAGGDPYLKQK